MRKIILMGVAGLGLAACQSAAPVSNPDIGYGYDAYGQGQTAQLNAPAPISSGPIGSNDLAAAGIGGAYGAAQPAPVAIQSSGISDEQDFGAVSSRETIESDAQRRAQAAAAYQVIQPTALPTAVDAGPNIVQYALSAPNRVGQPWYSRFIFSTQARANRNCLAYASADEAQRDFLARGGPERDPRGIDPDGDGFACAWDPAPFLAAVGRS